MLHLQQKYLEKALQYAIKVHSNRSMSLVKAAKRLRVPQTIIRNHKRQSSIAIVSGRPYLLTKIGEDHLVQLFLDLERSVFRLTKAKVIKIALGYANKKLVSVVF